MKRYIAFVVAILFVLSMVSATDIWYIADNKGTVQDIMLMQSVTTVIPTRGFSTQSKMNEEVSADDMKNACMSVFIFKNTALITASANCDNIAEDVEEFLIKKGATVVRKRANEINNDNLILELENKNLDPKCVEEDGVITYGDLELTSGCIGDTLFLYSCDGEEFVEQEEECNLGCKDAACITSHKVETKVYEEPEIKEESQEEEVDVEEEPPKEDAMPEPEPRGFVSRIVGFFKSLKFW